MRPETLAGGHGETVAAQALAVRFGPLPFSAMRRVRRALTDKPRSRWAIANASNTSIERTVAILGKLVKVGLAMKVGSGYARSGTAMPVLEDEAVPMAIGRQILLCLTEPRRTMDIARIIGRPPSNTAGQLQHLLRRGLVVRIGKGVYELAPPDKPPVLIPRPARPAKQPPLAVAGVRAPTEGRVPAASAHSLEA